MARRFGSTWWGQAWLQALEQRAFADQRRLQRGRTYARHGHVNEVDLSPGLVRASVDGSRVRPYTAQLGVRCLSDEDWDEVIDEMMNRAALSAALLSGIMPQELADSILPGRGDLSPDCSCPDDGDPCKHVAALCYVIADLFDADPFALLLLRGRGRDEVLAEIRQRRAVALGGVASEPSELPRGADPGMSAADAYRRTPVPLERSARLPRRPGVLATLAAQPPAGAGVDADELRDLVADAARRAFSLLSGEALSGLELSAGSDLARRAQYGNIARISAQTRIPQPELRAAAQAWRYGGAAGLAISRQKWTASSQQLGPGVLALGAASKARGNSVSLGPVQLRLDKDGTWWRFEADDELGWMLVGEGATDPTDLVDQAGNPD